MLYYDYKKPLLKKKKIEKSILKLKIETKICLKTLT